MAVVAVLAVVARVLQLIRWLVSTWTTRIQVSWFWMVVYVGTTAMAMPSQRLPAWLCMVLPTRSMVTVLHRTIPVLTTGMPRCVWSGPPTRWPTSCSAQTSVITLRMAITRVPRLPLLPILSTISVSLVRSTSWMSWRISWRTTVRRTAYRIAIQRMWVVCCSSTVVSAIQVVTLLYSWMQVGATAPANRLQTAWLTITP